MHFVVRVAPCRNLHTDPMASDSDSDVSWGSDMDDDVEEDESHVSKADAEMMLATFLIDAVDKGAMFAKTAGIICYWAKLGGLEGLVKKNWL